MEMESIKARECKHITYIPAVDDYREDTYVIKELIHYKDGTHKPNLRIMSNLKRSFYLTKPHYRNHKQKKESELLSKLNIYHATESDLGKIIASRLGPPYIGKTALRDVQSSPYLYGIDVNSKSIMIITLATFDRIYTVATKEYLKNSTNIVPQIDYLYNKYAPETEIKNHIHREFEEAENELDAIKKIFKKAHEWKPDFVAIWNITYDLPYMLDVLRKNYIKPEDIFSDPNIPKHLRYFRFKEGMKQKLTDSGKYTPINIEEQWHYVECPAHFYFIDAMSAHRYIRVGGKTMPGGYSLDNILEQELGEDFKKLKFDNNPKYKGIEWHKYMSREKPLEYIVYNMWDVMSMLVLDKKTKDLSHVITLLAGISPYDIFNSGPKKIIDAMHYYYLNQGEVLAAKPCKVEDDSMLNLSNWITLLPADRIKNKGLQLIEEDPELHMNTRTNVFDSDISGSYPSCTLACNVSRKTLDRELISIEGKEKEFFKLENINLFSGDVNATAYCVNMFNFPSIYELIEKYEKEKDILGAK